jgi:protein TonB
MLATLGPRLSLPEAAPVTVRFISEAPPQSAWQPPQAAIVKPAILTEMPELAPVETPVAAPALHHAITSNPPRTASAPAVDRSIPKQIATVEYLREPAPRYPPQSRRLREQGLVVLRVVIDERGVACDIDIESSSGHARLDLAAKEAVSRAAFRPYIEDGMPRRALVLIPIEFSLTSTAA